MREKEREKVERRASRNELASGIDSQVKQNHTNVNNDTKDNNKDVDAKPNRFARERATGVSSWALSFRTVFAPVALEGDTNPTY